MRHYFLSTALACAAGISQLTALDAPRTELATDLAPAPYMLSFDLSALRNGMQTAKPTSLWWDPAFATQRAHITTQIQMAAASEKEVPPFLDALSAGLAGIVTSYDIQTDSWDPTFAMAVDLGEAAPAWKTWIENTLAKKGQSTAGELKGYTGYYERADKKESGAFVGSKDNKIAGGSVRALTQADSIDPSSIAAAPVTLSIDFGGVIDRIAFITENDRDRYNFSAWGPLLDGARPTASATIQADANGWQGDVTINGLGDYQAPAIGDAILKTIPANSALWLVQHVDLDNVLAKIKEKAPPQQLDMIAAMTGSDIDSIVSWFTGDLAIAVKPAALIPEISISISLKDEDKVLALITPFIAAQGQALEIAGANKAWVLNIPQVPNPIYLAIGKQTLIASNNNQSIADVLAGTALTDASSAAGKAGHLFIDLPTIAQAYLPMVWGMAMNAHQDLAQSLLTKTRWSIRSVFSNLDASAAIDNAAVEAALSDVWNKQDMQALFKTEDLAAACLANVSAWKVAADTQNADADHGDASLAVYVHTQDGYVNVSEWQANPVSLEDAQATVSSMVKFSGPDLATLPEIHVDAPPSFDKRWLPSLPQLIEHLPTYEVSLASDQAGQARIHEQGLPLMTTILGGLGSIVYFETADRSARLLRRQKEASEAASQEKSEQNSNVEESGDMIDEAPLTPEQDDMNNDTP